MRKSEPDSKYFVKSLENEVLPVKINKNRRKLCKLFTVWFPKELVMYSLSKFRHDGRPDFEVTYLHFWKYVFKTIFCELPPDRLFQTV